MQCMQYNSQRGHSADCTPAPSRTNKARPLYNGCVSDYVSNANSSGHQNIQISDSNVSNSQTEISQCRCWQISDSRQSLVLSSTQRANTHARACDTTSYCTAQNSGSCQRILTRLWCFKVNSCWQQEGRGMWNAIHLFAWYQWHISSKFNWSKTQTTSVTAQHSGSHQ